MIRRAWNATKSWFSQTWDDLKASADAGLLGGARFLGLIYGPIDRRLRIDDALRKALQYRLDPHVGWRQMFGGITYVLFMMLVVTGVLLALYYRPSVQEANPSVQHIVSHVSFGWLIYHVHVWSASLRPTGPSGCSCWEWSSRSAPAATCCPGISGPTGR
jgi:hypothetical protein